VSRRRVPKLDQELTFREAAAALKRLNDPEGRRLKKMVLARERQSKKPIAIRLAGSKVPKLRVTLGALYRAFPEARSSRVDDLAEVFRPMVERMDARNDARTEKMIHKILESKIEPRLQLLEKKATLTTRYITDLQRLERHESARIDRTRTPG
jgi:hypothetical protein